MKKIIYLLVTILAFIGCSKSPQTTVKEKFTSSVTVEESIIEDNNQTLSSIDKSLDSKKKSDFVDGEILFSFLSKTYLSKSDFDSLPNWDDENYQLALDSFLNSCKTKKTQKLYKDLCKKATKVKFAKYFLQNEFDPYEIKSKKSSKGLLTGYYEPLIRGSLKKKYPYIYPIYETPKDLIVVDLGSIYPNLKNYRLRGKLQGNKLVPYYTRKQTQSKHLKSKVICYTDSKIDLFFLEVQGSGRVKLDNGKTIYIGYDNQNGHRYKSIGRYLVKKKEIPLKDISLQSIREWLKKHPKRIDEVLNYNKSVVFFKQRKQPATGSLGLELTPKRSIAVDRRFIPLGSMLYLDSKIKDKSISSIVVAQDTGGAIKGAIRADLFLGYGDEAMSIAGELKSPLKLWILLPKKAKKESL